MMHTLHLMNSYKLSGSLDELKFALKANSASAGEGYAELKEILFKQYEKELPLCKLLPTTDYNMRSVRELKLKFGEQPITSNPF